MERLTELEERVSKKRKLDELLKKISYEVSDALPEYESRQLFAIPADKVKILCDKVKEDSGWYPDSKTAVFLAIGFNYYEPDINPVLFGWHDMFGFELLSVEAGERIKLDTLEYFVHLVRVVNENFVEIQELYIETYR